MKVYDYTAVVEFDADAQRYVGYFPAVRGAITDADTLEELRGNLKEVLELMLEGQAEDNLPFAADNVVGLERVTVEV